MRVLIAPNAFKGTIEADEAAKIIQKAILESLPHAETELCPIADGGDGTCLLLGQALGLSPIYQMVPNALGKPIKGFYSFDQPNHTAYLDISTASGIKDLKSFERNPWITSSYGTGELINSAIRSGAAHIVLGLGGSATVDMGLGILRAMGYLFLDMNGREIPMFSDGFIQKIKHIQAPILKPGISFTCLCDVSNIFLGEKGAVPIFGPQKGLEAEKLSDFEKACKRVIDILAKKSGKKIIDKPGFGAAGGIALGLSAFFPTQIQMGAKWFFETIDIEEKVKNADLVITGEGKYDSQSEGGKGSYELLQIVKRHHKKIFLITSGLSGEESMFDEIIRLPDLDLDQKGFEEKARLNLLRRVRDFQKWE